MVKKTVYSDISEIDGLQTKIMQYIQTWVHDRKTPVPLKEVIIAMTKQGIKIFTTRKALEVLIRKGFIRRSFAVSNKTSFVQLRRV